MSLLKKARLNVYIFTLLLIGLFSQPLAATQEINITKSNHDDRSYLGLHLDNGMNVLLVSDPTAEKAAVALNVEVGSFNEPSERTGLAHFLEHMLFLGTEKHPDPNEYSRFISEHGGLDNAWTGGRNTQYYYTILPQYLPESLDRFSQFFIAPLFNKELVDRERHAVDNEYHLSLKKDGWRINEVSKVTANPKHPYSRFSIGNIETLGDASNLPPIREQLIDFYNNNYSADRMTLAVVGPQSLQDLQKLVEKYFNYIPKRKVHDNQIAALAYTGNETAQRIMVQTLGDYQEMSMEFPIPSQKESYNNKSIDYILYLIQQTGPDSLYQLLKNKNWITGISAGTDDLTTKQDLVNLTFTLTPDGLKNISNIVSCTFSYIYFLKDVGPQKDIFNDLRSAGERNFTYADKQDPGEFVASLPGDMHKFPLPKILRANTFTNDSEYNPEKIKDLFNYLTPANLRLYIVNPKVKGDKYEKYYQVNYKTEKLNKTELERWSRRDPEIKFALPKPNIFLPENFKILANTSIDLSEQVPQKLISEPGVTVWFKQNMRFQLPVVNIIYQLQAPNTNSTARRALLAKFMQYSLDDKLSNLTSQFALAGVNVSDDISDNGLTISIYMFSDKIYEVTREIFKYVQDPTINASRFNSYKDDIKRDLLNFKQLHPYAQAAKIIYATIYEPQWLPSELLAEINTVTIQEVEQYTKEFLSQLQMVALLNGNVEATEMKTYINDILKLVPIDTQRVAVDPKPKIISLKAGNNFYYKYNPHHNDGVLVSYHQCPSTGDKSVAMNLLLVDILDRPLFDQLRTKEQLGYVVGINAIREREQAGQLFYIEASKKQPTFLQERLTSFLKSFSKQLVTMPSKDFETYKASLEAVLLQKPNSLLEETARYWRKINDQSYRFNYEKEIAAEVRKLELKELSTLLDSMWLTPKDSRVINVISQQKGALAANMKEIKSISEFKSKQVYK